MGNLRKFLSQAIVLCFFLFPFFVFGDSSCSGSVICNPLSGNSDLITFFNTILDKVVIPVGAILAAIFVIYSGFLFVTARGSDDKIKTAKNNLLYVVIGAAIILGAKAIAAGIQATVTSIQQ